MAAVIFHEPVFATTVESGDKLFFYEVGTTTDLIVYTDYALSTAASQPVVADADGRIAPIYFDATGNDPKVVLKDSDDVEKWTCDRYPVDDLTTLTASVATNTSDIAVLEGRMATAEEDIDVLETESADYESRITDLENVTGNVTDADFTGSNQSLTTDGYQILPGGLIFQWGFKSLDGGGTFTVTLPTPFTTAVFIVFGGAGALDKFDDEASQSAGKDGSSLTTIKVTTDGQGGGTSWIAIGY